MMSSGSLEKCGRTVFEIVSPTDDSETIKMGYPSCQIVTIISLSNCLNIWWITVQICPCTIKLKVNPTNMNLKTLDNDYNHGNNILELCNFSENFGFSASKSDGSYVV